MEIHKINVPPCSHDYNSEGFCIYCREEQKNWICQECGGSHTKAEANKHYAMGHTVEPWE